MPIQTTYPFQNDPLLKGMKADALNDRCVTAYSDEVIPVGIGLAYGDENGTEDRPKVNIPSATGFKFMGISAFVHKDMTDSNAGLGDLTSDETTQYEIGEDITVARKTRRRVETVDGANPNLPVFLYHTGPNAGNFGSIANANADDVSEDCEWVSVLGSAGLATLEVSLP